MKHKKVNDIDLFLAFLYLVSVLIVFIGLREQGMGIAESLVQAFFWPFKMLDMVIGGYIRGI